MTEVGSEYTRKAGNGPASLKVVGQKSGRWVCQEIETFSSPFELTPIELHRDYGGDGESVVEVSEADMWQLIGRRKLRESNIAAALQTRQRERDEESPEAFFRRQDREAAEAG
jgi:hypothetical protein